MNYLIYLYNNYYFPMNIEIEIIFSHILLTLFFWALYPSIMIFILIRIMSNILNVYAFCSTIILYILAILCIKNIKRFKNYILIILFGSSYLIVIFIFCSIKNLFRNKNNILKILTIFILSLELLLLYYVIIYIIFSFMVILHMYWNSTYLICL